MDFAFIMKRKQSRKYILTGKNKAVAFEDAAVLFFVVKSPLRFRFFCIAE